jgi:hypothetical protein
MDANEAREIEKNIIQFITHHFGVEGGNLYEKLQFLAVASRVKDKIKRSLKDDLHELRILRNKVSHEEDKALLDLYDKVWEGLLRLAVPERSNIPFWIINKLSGRYLDVPCGFENGRIHQWSGHRGKNQQWILRRSEDESIVVISALSGKCLDIEGHSFEMPAWLQVWHHLGGANQKFTFTQLEDGAYSIAARHSGLVLDCNSHDDGALITQWAWHGGDNQRWYVNPAF